MRILVTRTPDAEVLAHLRSGAEVDLFEEDRPIPREALVARARGVDGIVSMLTDRIDAEVLDAAGPGLRAIANHAAGYDNVDLEACARRGVVVTNTPDVLTDATADLTWGLILAARRRIAEGDRHVRARKPWDWSPTFMLGREVTGATLGIVGYGRIGRAVARRAEGFGMRVIVHTRTPGEGTVDLATLLREADVVSLHLPLTEATRGLIDAEALRTMRPTAVLVNTSRGPVVEEAALAEALAGGEIAAAGLDVYEREPDIHPRLLELENVVLVPHLGSATVETRRAMGMLAARNLLAILRGEPPLTPVTPR